MVALPLASSPAAASSPALPPTLSLEDWLDNPPERMEWIDGSLIAKNGTTLKHSKIQARLAVCWKIHLDHQQLAGEVYTEAPCRTQKQGRVPDVAYLTPELVAQYGDAKVLPQSFPLSAEVISPTDLAEEVIGKAQEYLQSGSEEVWLVFPEAGWVIALTPETRQIFTVGEIARTTTVLPGFAVAIDELLA